MIAPPAALEKDGWRFWLATLRTRGWAHGNDLAVALMVDGDDDFIGSADRCLLWAESEGLVVREPDPLPTLDQRVLQRPYDGRSSPSWHGYRPGAAP